MEKSGIYFVISNEIMWNQPHESVYVAVFRWAERKYTCFLGKYRIWDKPRTNSTYENISNLLFESNCIILRHYLSIDVKHII